MIGTEVRRQAMEKWGGKPDILLAYVGGGSDAMGLFHEFIEDEKIRLISVEAAGFGTDIDEHAATLTMGEIGVLHGAMSYLLQDVDGQIIEPHSISAGLDYPGVGPEHSFFKDVGRAEYFSMTDDEALEGCRNHLLGNRHEEGGQGVEAGKEYRQHLRSYRSSKAAKPSAPLVLSASSGAAAVLECKILVYTRLVFL